MIKKINFILLFLTSICCNAMQREKHLSAAQELQIKYRVAEFNKWKRDPEIATRLNADEPVTVQAYIHLTMFMREPEELAKSPEKLTEATQLAQQVCPSYRHWPEFYEVYSRVKRGKCYSDKEQIELVLAPTMVEITRLKVMLALLKGEDPAAIQINPDWQREAESLRAQRIDLNLIHLIPLAVPSKKQELDRLNKEFEHLSKSENLQEVVAQATRRTQSILADAQAKQMALQSKEAEIARLKIQCEADIRKATGYQEANDALEKQTQSLTTTINRQKTALETKDTELEQIRNQAQRSLQAREAQIAQLQELKKRIMSTLALFEASKATGWESSFIGALKAEFEKYEIK